MGGRSYGVSVASSRNIQIDSVAVSGAHRGIVIDRSQNVALVGNRLTGLISDGIDIALSHGVRVERNSCRDFRPSPASYDPNGKLVSDGDYPDCIQAWSRPPARPTSELTIIGNDIEGRMQGIFLGNHVRDGVDDGGFDRVVFRGNRVRVAFSNGIAIAEGAKCAGHGQRCPEHSRVHAAEQAGASKGVDPNKRLRDCGVRQPSGCRAERFRDPALPLTEAVMHRALVANHDVNDVSKWAATPFYIVRALRKRVPGLIVVNTPRVDRAMHLLTKLTMRFRLDLFRESIVTCLYAWHLRRSFIAKGADALISVGATHKICDLT